MKCVLSRNEAYQIDNEAMKLIPSSVLMENAGKGVYEFIRTTYPKAKRIALFCGHGNNGGDGFVIARLLKENGCYPEIFLLGDSNKFSPETKRNFELLSNIPKYEAANSFKQNLDDYDLIVDAIYGIGFRGTLNSQIEMIINKINMANSSKIAVDISSGLDADNGLCDNAFNADYTLTMGAYKYGHFLGQGMDYSGIVNVVDIGFPESAFQGISVNLATRDDIVYPNRKRSYHKANYGKIAIIAGSSEYKGAAVLAARAALKSGAGLITLFHPPEIDPSTQLTEVMCRPIPQDFYNHHKTNDYALHESEILDFIKDYDVLLLGPGIGVSPFSTNLVDIITKHWKKPLVLDADALNILSQNPQWLDRLENAIITPHIGEFARLCNKTSQDILDNPIRHAVEFSSKYNLVLLLKSSYRLIIASGDIRIDISGNDGLATGGSGDVLAGITVSFLGQNLSPFNAAVSASYLLGTTAEYCNEYLHTPAITPTDIIDNLFRKE